MIVHSDEKEKADINTQTLSRNDSNTNTYSDGSRQGDQRRDTGDMRSRSQDRLREIQKNDRLIASDRVEGTEVYDREGNKLGTVRKMMIEKRSGTVRHVIVGYGGFMGVGEDNFPLPWDTLEYDEKCDGYVSRIDKDRMRSDDAPRYGKNDEPEWDEGYQRRITTYYFPIA